MYENIPPESRSLLTFHGASSAVAGGSFLQLERALMALLAARAAWTG